MYSGITKGLYDVIALTILPGLSNYTVHLSPELCSGLTPGDSVSVDGVCQTVVRIEGTSVSFQAIQETLDRTTLQALHLGYRVSIERSLRWGDEMGGHEVFGHVFGQGCIHEIRQEHDHLTVIIQCNPSWMKYILPKGFIAVDGSSLTVGKTYPELGLFFLHLIPETIQRTHFSYKKASDHVNLEFDHKTKTIVDTVERVMSTTQWSVPQHA